MNQNAKRKNRPCWKTGLFWSSLGKSVCFIFLYLGSQLVSSLVVSFVLGIVGTFRLISQQNVVIDETFIMEELGDMLLYALLVSSVLTIAALWIFYTVRGKRFSEVPGWYAVPAGELAGPLALGFGLAILFTLLLNVIPFPETLMDSYAEQMSDMMSGSLWLELLVTVIAAPVTEELIFRGLVYSHLKRGMPTAAAMILSAVFFGLVHGTLVHLIYVIPLGLVLCFAYEKYQTLWAAITVHAGFNLVSMVMPYIESWVLLLVCGVLLTGIGAALVFTKKSEQRLPKRQTFSGTVQDTIMEEKISEVKPYAGVPALYLHGEPVPGMAYITYDTENNRYADFAKAGYRLFSVPVFFAGRTINDTTQIPPFNRGIFDNSTCPDFAVFDREIERLLAAAPDGLIFPRLNLSLPAWWDMAHPDELCDTGFTPQHRVCFSSDVWARETKRMISVFLAHVDAMPWKEHIIGWQIAGGNTEEWFSFDQQGSVGRRSREAFEKWKTERALAGTEAEYYHFLSEITAKRICEFASCVKLLTRNRMVVGTFYGYTMECVDRKSCHHALKTVLNCKDIDFICSPVSYAQTRAAGRDHANMLPIDSVKLHGKLYFAENDTRTDLSQAPNDLPAYHAPIWFGPDREASIEVIKLHFSRALIHGHAMWWFDMWGGWYDAPEYMTLMKKMRKICCDALGKPAESAAQMAVFVDERAYDGIADPSVSARVCYNFRELLGRSGVPYDIYLTDDFETVVSRYRAAVFLVPAMTEAMASCIAYTETNGCPHLVVNDDTVSGITTETLRALCREAGVPVICDWDAVIYENRRFLFLHTPEDGEYVLHTDCALTDAFSGEPVLNLICAEKGKSFLFIKGEAFPADTASDIPATEPELYENQASENLKGDFQ